MPLPVLDTQSDQELEALATEFQDSLIASNTFAGVHVHDRKWWVRSSAQIWLEVRPSCVLERARILHFADSEYCIQVSDFVKLANILVDLCKDFRERILPSP